MKVLIYGEYSGYCKSLAKGIRDNEIEASVFSPTGDGWKGIDSEISLTGSGFFGKSISLIKTIPKFLKFDVILITNPSFMAFSYLGPLILTLFFLFKKRVYLLACGDDHEYIMAVKRGIIKKSPFSNGYLPVERYFIRKRDRFIHHWCALQSKAIIPVMYDYHLAWTSSKYNYKVTKSIQLACYRSDDVKIKPVDYDKINILHGINRPIVKGSEVIISALKRLESSNQCVNILTPSNLPQSQYLELMKDVDIAIDQCKTHSYGMNGIYSMLTGHILISSADKEYCNSVGLDTVPVINVTDDEEDIYQKLCELIKRKNLDELKLQNYKFASTFHNPKHVASLMLAVIMQHERRTEF